MNLERLTIKQGKVCILYAVFILEFIHSFMYLVYQLCIDLFILIYVFDCVII